MTRNNDKKFSGGEMGLELEKINAQRITGLEESFRYVERKVDDLAKDLPKIVQDAISQAVGTANKNSNSNGNGNGNGNYKNGNGNGSGTILTIFITIVIAMSTIFGQQILFIYNLSEKNSQTAKDHIKEAHVKDIELARLEENVKWIKYLEGVESTNEGLKGLRG